MSTSDPQDPAVQEDPEQETEPLTVDPEKIAHIASSELSKVRLPGVILFLAGIILIGVLSYLDLQLPVIVYVGLFIASMVGLAMLFWKAPLADCFDAHPNGVAVYKQVAELPQKHVTQKELDEFNALYACAHESYEDNRESHVQCMRGNVRFC